MSDLAEFLRARIDEDERGVHEWAQPRPDGLLTSSLRPIHEWTEHAGPARVLAEVAAKRALIEHTERGPTDRVGVVGPALDYGHGLAAGFEFTLRYLARPYAEHPDFDPAWRMPGPGDAGEGG